MTKRALITGITGQDGSYLAEFLLDQGYEIFGMVRRSSTVTFERIAHLQDRISTVFADLLDQHAPALADTAGTVFTGPACKRRVVHRVGQVVAQRFRPEYRRRERRQLAMQSR